MKSTLAVLIVAALPAATLAQSTPSAATSEPGFHAQLYQRYCDKLRESPEAYVAFVKRLKTVHGYSIEEFAPREPTDQVRAVCREANAQVARATEAASKR